MTDLWARGSKFKLVVYPSVYLLHTTVCTLQGQLQYAPKVKKKVCDLEWSYNKWELNRSRGVNKSRIPPCGFMPPTLKEVLREFLITVLTCMTPVNNMWETCCLHYWLFSQDYRELIESWTLWCHHEVDIQYNHFIICVNVIIISSASWVMGKNMFCGVTVTLTKI